MPVEVSRRILSLLIMVMVTDRLSWWIDSNSNSNGNGNDDGNGNSNSSSSRSGNSCDSISSIYIQSIHGERALT